MLCKYKTPLTNKCILISKNISSKKHNIMLHNIHALWLNPAVVLVILLPHSATCCYGGRSTQDICTKKDWCDIYFFFGPYMIFCACKIFVSEALRICNMLRICLKGMFVFCKTKCINFAVANWIVGLMSSMFFTYYMSTFTRASYQSLASFSYLPHWRVSNLNMWVLVMNTVLSCFFIPFNLSRRSSSLFIVIKK